MNKDKEKSSIIISIVVTAIIIFWLISSMGCANYQLNKRLEKPGHWPGWIFEKTDPYYGPHDITHAQQIELRNAYSDGWQDRGEAYNKYKQ